MNTTKPYSQIEKVGKDMLVARPVYGCFACRDLFGRLKLLYGVYGVASAGPEVFSLFKGVLREYMLHHAYVHPSGVGGVVVLVNDD